MRNIRKYLLLNLILEHAVVDVVYKFDEKSTASIWKVSRPLKCHSNFLGVTHTVEYRVSARHRVSAHPVIFSLEGNSSLLRTISGKRPPIDFSSWIVKRPRR